MAGSVHNMTQCVEVPHLNLMSWRWRCLSPLSHPAAGWCRRLS